MVDKEKELIFKFLDENYYIKDYNFFYRGIEDPNIIYDYRNDLVEIIKTLLIVFGLDKNTTYYIVKLWCLENGFIISDFEYYNTIEEQNITGLLAHNKDYGIESIKEALISFFLTKMNHTNTDKFLIDLNTLLHEPRIYDLKILLNCIGYDARISREDTFVESYVIQFHKIYNYKVKATRLTSKIWKEITANNKILI